MIYKINKHEKILRTNDMISDNQGVSLREKCPYSELFWSVFSCFRTEYGEIFGKAARIVFPPTFL